MRNKCMRMTTFQLTEKLYSDLKMMCMLTHKSMGEFIRVSVREKICSLKNKKELTE